MTDSNPLRGLFITGTNTDVGKTYITAMIARQLTNQGVNVGVYKPVCSGSTVGDDGVEIWSDVIRLSEAVGNRFPADWICPQRFFAALAPPAAANREGRTVDSEQLRTGLKRWEGVVDTLLVEGVGGWLCPIAKGETVADLAVDIGFPILVVVGLELGAVSHTLLTLESIRRSGLSIAGIVLNHHRGDGDAEVSLATESGIREQSGVPILATVFHADDDFPADDDRRLPDEASPEVDWNLVCATNVSKTIDGEESSRHSPSAVSKRLTE